MFTSSHFGRAKRSYSGSVVMIGFILSTVRGVSGNSRCAAGTCRSVLAERVVEGGPSWVLSSEYPSLESVELKSDLDRVRDLVKEIGGVENAISGYLDNCEGLSVNECQVNGVLDALTLSSKLKSEAEVLLRNVGVYSSCEKSVDGSNIDARKKSLEVQEVAARLGEVTLSKDLFLMRCADDVVSEFLSANNETKAEAAHIRRQRKLRDSRLSLQEEKLYTTLSVNGHSSWGTMYSTISGTIKCDITLADGSKEKVGLATAAGYLDNPSEAVRRSAFEGIRDSWAVHEESCAAALNSMVGWRLDMYKRRGLHFLDTPLHQNRMTKKTLDTMLRVVEDRSELARRVLRTKAKLLGKQKLDAWDLFAPLPAEIAENQEIEGRYTFEEAVQLIKESVGSIDQEMGDFVQLMADNGWIEARKASQKVPGAYQTEFSKSRTPRVYLSDYNGGAAHVLTLAHELGHAFHSWTMRELAVPETYLGMNVAETASIFFETVVSGALLNRTTNELERLRILWAACENASAFLLNIPARFRFEEQLHIQREKQSLTPSELSSLMEQAWTDQYKDSLATVQPFFWQSKLHFYITGVCFYNFPYTFGWLLALGVYNQRERLGDKFFDAYKALLRDTGKLDTEELVLAHLNEDIGEDAFWNKSLDTVERIVKEFETQASMIKPIPGPVYDA
ncbi:hypothetical protein NDN08_005518 [Rhodosorus marinus]|uniref:Peptidase M3A/M3B catalytic domain-containing protein n=1 Tax=Rhodosorus marinus TaxID=101924 RepID=A0AAV8V3E6_9RHOD|nr:hypothetical protein NDN08_005518 [Rhodosorus marinus]